MRPDPPILLGAPAEQPGARPLWPKDPLRWNPLQ